MLPAAESEPELIGEAPKPNELLAPQQNSELGTQAIPEKSWNTD